MSAQSSAFTITVGPASTITATGGTPQSTIVLAPFAAPLQVLVSDAVGNPLSGVTVTFASVGCTEPRRRCSATVTATTDAAGHASVTAVANAVVGSYTVTASVTGIASTGQLRADQRGRNGRQSGVHAASH